MIPACERAGNYRKCNVGDIGGKGKHKPQTDTNKFGCQFELKGKKLGMDNEQVRWELTVICGSHNHTDFENMKGHSFAGRLSNEVMAIVENMSKELVKPILTTLEKRDGTNATTQFMILTEGKRDGW